MKNKKKNIAFFFRTWLTPFIMLVLTQAVWAGNDDFTITVSTTAETCNGNGTLTITPHNATPGADILYEIFLLPDTTTPIPHDPYDTFAPSLQSGTYLVVATHVINGVETTVQEETVVGNQESQLEFNITSTPEACSYDGTITVAVTEGTATQYEIFDGPVTAPVQTSPQFTGLTAGTYIIRIYDDCGNAYTTSYQLFTTYSPLTVMGPSFPDAALPSCNEITIKYTVIAQDSDIGITFPLTPNLIITPPDGGPDMVFTPILTFADFALAEFSCVIPFYYDTEYYADFSVTDACGIVYELNDMVIDQKLQATYSLTNAICGKKYLTIGVFKYGSPYTIEFTSPIDFDPSEYNELYPGPYTEANNDFGEFEVPLPYGDYEFYVYDSCGREVGPILIENDPPDEEPEPEDNTTNNDCENGLGRAVIFIPNFDIEFAEITVSPPEYSDINPLPSDESEDIETNEDDPDYGELDMDDLPAGDYTVELIDTCGNLYTYDFTVPEVQVNPPSKFSRPDCEEGLGTLYISSGPPIIYASLTSAPEEFTEELPLDAMDYMTESSITMENLPPGTYVFEVDTECSTELDPIIIEVPAYEVTINDIEVTRHCGSFDISLSHEANNTGSDFALQYYDEENGTWAHPLTLMPYEEGTEPLISDTDPEANALELDNNDIYVNLSRKGGYRVIKTFNSFGDGSQGIKDKVCIIILEEFDFYDDLQISDMINLTCSGNIADVQINAIGVEPITYKIISKNGDINFIVDNGTDNVFEDLEAAIYVVEVRDPCGNIRTATFNVADLPSLVNANDADDLEDCDIDGDGQQTFDLSVQDDNILNGQDTAEVALTYHDNLNDAEANTNQLPAIYTASIGTKTLYGRVSSIADPECFDLESFDVTVNGAGSLAMETLWPACEGESVTVIADSGFVSYEWSNGAVTPSITVTESGTYTVTVTDENGCTISQEVEVIISSLPQIHHIEVNDWTDNSNVITVVMEDSDSPENFEYSLDGVHYQESNIFTNLPPGEYDIYVRDISGCGNDNAGAYLLTYPKFFTPNGDGINETWRIRYSINEPDMLIYIFDRYGKLITGFGPNSPGWDGTLNGSKLPSTDYWFVVKRQNGKEHKGHFSMIR